MKLYEAKQILKKNGYKLLKEKKPSEFFTYNIDQCSGGTMIDLYLKIHDYELFDNLLDFINNFGDSDQPITASDVRDDDTINVNDDAYWYMTVFFDGEDKPEYNDTSFVADVFEDIMSQFDWDKYI